jgi:hypothetical protein
MMGVVQVQVRLFGIFLFKTAVYVSAEFTSDTTVTGTLISTDTSRIKRNIFQG